MFRRLAVSLMIAVSASAENGWTWRNPLPNSFFWRGLSVSHDAIYLAGERAIAVSTNGLDWSFQEWRLPGILCGLTWAEDRLFVLTVLEPTPTQDYRSAVYAGNGGDLSFVTELTGVFTKIVHGNGRFLACSQGVISSADGRRWTTLHAAQPYLVPGIDVLFGGGRFLYSIGSRVFLSTNGRRSAPTAIRRIPAPESSNLIDWIDLARSQNHDVAELSTDKSPIEFFRLILPPE